MSKQQPNGDTRERLLPPLSPRETEVLANASLGLSNGEIAERLHVTVHAVKFHLAAIYRKLGVANRTSASVIYLRQHSNGQELSKFMETRG